jgi:hypothetical protein
MTRKKKLIQLFTYFLFLNSNIKHKYTYINLNTQLQIVRNRIKENICSRQNIILILSIILLLIKTVKYILFI